MISKTERLHAIQKDLYDALIDAWTTTLQKHQVNTNIDVERLAKDALKFGVYSVCIPYTAKERMSPAEIGSMAQGFAEKIHSRATEGSLGLVLAPDEDDMIYE